jgi:hypothetical protein
MRIEEVAPDLEREVQAAFIMHNVVADQSLKWSVPEACLW